jgi:hypothetical protein
MFTPSGDYAESRPFKIYISLLDKWEIGAALTDVLVYDAFRAIKQFVELNPDTAEDVRQCFFCADGIGSHIMEIEQMIMTATTLYESVEPHVVWKQLLAGFVAEITGDGNDFEVRGYKNGANDYPHH